MDILGPILAYLGCVTGMLCAAVIAFMVYFSPPAQSAASKANLATASAAKVTTIAQAKPATKTEAPKIEAPKTERRDTHVASIAADAAVAPQPTVALSARHKAQISRTQYYRRLVQEERLKRLAYQQNPDFEARFLGYAD